MKHIFHRLALALCLCACSPVTAREQDYSDEDALILDQHVQQDGAEPESSALPSAEFLSCNKAAWRIPGQYLVVLQRGTHHSHVQRTVRRLQAKAAKRGYRLEILHTFSGAFHGFLVKMSSDVLHLAVKLPHVDYIEEDSFIFAQNIPWNLQRLTQPSSVANDSGRYHPTNDGGMAEVYLMDGSVQRSHREIEERTFITDFSNIPEEDGVRAHRQASQCDSHGTHTAGVVSGRDSGVARGAGVNLVRVLNCQGKGTVSGALAGLEYIRAVLLARPVESVVVLLPFIGGFSRSLNAACRQTVADGAVVIAAAGNYMDDACLYSPASEPEVITVGAVNSEDQPMALGAGGTNAGRCVDLFAPGDDIISASSDCATCFTSRSGTSAAAAHVAGVAAVILSSHPNASSVEILQKMLVQAVPGTMNPFSLPEHLRHTTPNLVVALSSSETAQNAEEDLLCRSVWSKRSGVNVGESVVARCRQGEEMMGCTSYAPEGGRMGETISEQEGLRECVALNGGKGVHAIARCCVLGGLQCRVHTSPKPGLDAECSNSSHPHLTGCSSLSVAEFTSDSLPRHGDQKRCVTTEQATSHAVCCHAPSLECHVLEQEAVRNNEQVALSCSSGWTLTDCAAASLSSASRGPIARGNTCLVRSAAGAEEAVVMATCCRVGRSQPPTAREH